MLSGAYLDLILLTAVHGDMEAVEMVFMNDALTKSISTQRDIFVQVWRPPRKVGVYLLRTNL